MAPTRSFGRLVSKDGRDFRYTVSRKTSDRTSRYWDDNLVLDQADAPSCVGHAWSHWLYAPPFEQFLLPNGIYTVSQFLDEWPGEDYEGTSVRGGAKVLKLLGFISQYHWAHSVDDMANTILEQGPVVVGTDWYSDMNLGGVLSASGDLLGGHAYLIDGVDVNTKMFRMKNSWGPSWGDNGRAQIPFDQMQILLDRDGEACLGVEIVVSPEVPDIVIDPVSPGNTPKAPSLWARIIAWIRNFLGL